MEVSNQLHAPAALRPWKEPQIPIEQGAGWTPRAALEAMEKKKILHLTRNEPWDMISYSPTDYRCLEKISDSVLKVRIARQATERCKK
jgi:hypothetical protein